MDHLNCIQVYHRVPVLLDNVIEYDKPQVVSTYADPSYRNSDKGYPHHKKPGHLLYFIDQSGSIFNQDQSPGYSNYNGDTPSDEEASIALYKQHIQAPLRAGMWVQQFPLNQDDRQGVHWRITSSGHTLELRLVRFTSSGSNTTQINGQNANSSRPKDSFSSNSDISPLLSLVFPEPLEGDVDFIQDRSQGNIQDHPYSLILWALSLSGTVYRIAFNDIGDIGHQERIREIQLDNYKLLSKSPIDPNLSNYSITGNHSSYRNFVNRSKNGIADLAFKQIKALNSQSALIYWKDGLLATISGFQNSAISRSNRIAESKFNMIEQPKRSFVSQIYKSNQNHDDINQLKTILVSPQTTTNGLITNLVFGLESNRALWVWNSGSGKERERVQIKLPSFGNDNGFLATSDKAAFVCELTDYNQVYNTTKSHLVQDYTVPQHRERIALLVYVPDNQHGYFALLEGIIDYPNFSNSVLLLSGIKKLLGIFGTESAIQTLVDVKISRGQFNTSTLSFNWKIFTLWENGSNETVMHGFVETLPSSLVDTSPPNSNDDSVALGLESFVKWGKSSSIGERWVPDHSFADQIRPQPTHGKLELLHDWLISKKSTLEFVNNLVYSLDQELELQIGDNLKDKLASKIHSTMADFVMHPVHYSSSTIQYALELYKSKSKLPTNSTANERQGSSLRSTLINTIGKNISFSGKETHQNNTVHIGSEDESNENQTYQQNAYEYGYRLYTEWMWFLQIITQVQIDHCSAFQLFVDPEIGLAGVARSLSFETLQLGTDFDWIAEKIKPNPSYSDALRVLNTENFTSSRKINANLSTASSFILTCPPHLLDKASYSLAKSAEKNNILFVCSAINTLNSSLSLLAKAQLVSGIELRFKGGIYLDIEGELAKLFKEVFINNTEGLSAPLSEAISLLAKIENISSTILQIFDMLMFAESGDNNLAQINDESKNTNGIQGTSMNCYLPSASIVAAEAAFRFIAGYDIISEILILLSAVSFILNELKNDNNMAENDPGYQQPTMTFKSGKSVSYVQLLALLDSKNKSKLFAKAIDAFRFYSFCKKFSENTTLGHAPAKANSILNEIYSTKFDQGFEFSENQNQLQHKLFKPILSDPSRAENPSYFEYTCKSTSYNLLQSSVLDWLDSFRDDGSKGSQKQNLLNNQSPEYRVSDSFHLFLFERMLESQNPTQPTMIAVAGKPQNGIEPNVEKNLFKQATLNDFHSSIHKLVKLCATDIIDPEQILVLLELLPTVFHVAFLSGIALIQLGKHINASDCFLSAASVVFSLDNPEKYPEQLKEDGYVKFVSKFKGWLDSFGILDTNPASYYLKVANIFERVKSYSIACDFYSLALERIDPKMSSSNNGGFKEIENSERACFNLGDIYTKLFHATIESNQVEKAYLSILSNPDVDLRLECLRLFVNVCLDSNNTAWRRLLVTLPFPGLLNEVERCLLFKARNSKLNTQFLFSNDTKPNSDNELDHHVNYYHVVFSFYIKWNNYREAASIMYQYSQRLQKLYKPAKYPNKAEKTIKAYQKWLELLLQSLLMSVQTLEMANKEEKYILVRKLVLPIKQNKIEGRGYKRKAGGDFISFNQAASGFEDTKGQENIFIVNLDDIRHLYELVRANKTLVDYIASQNYGEGLDYTPYLEIIMNPNILVSSFFQLGLAHDCIELAIRLRADYRSVLTDFVKLYFEAEKTRSSIKESPGYQSSAFESSQPHEEWWSLLKRIFNCFESDLKAKNQSDNEGNLLKLHVVQEILAYNHEKMANTGSQLQVAVSLALPSWLTQPLLASRPVDLIRVCHQKHAILEASCFLVLFIKREVLKLQSNTQLAKHFNKYYIPYGLIAQVKADTDLALSKLIECRTAVNPNVETEPPTASVSRERLYDQYDYFIAMMQQRVHDIDYWLDKYLVYIERETKEVKNNSAHKNFKKPSVAQE